MTFPMQNQLGNILLNRGGIFWKTLLVILEKLLEIFLRSLPEKKKIVSRGKHYIFEDFFKVSSTNPSEDFSRNSFKDSFLSSYDFSFQILFQKFAQEFFWEFIQRFILRFLQVLLRKFVHRFLQKFLQSFSRN